MCATIQARRREGGGLPHTGLAQLVYYERRPVEESAGASRGRKVGKWVRVIASERRQWPCNRIALINFINESLGRERDLAANYVSIRESSWG